ncbi:MAG: hypothetical protein AAFY59_20580, partial [Pseudomonadota bacterium]
MGNLPTASQKPRTASARHISRLPSQGPTRRFGRMHTSPPPRDNLRGIAWILLSVVAASIM